MKKIIFFLTIVSLLLLIGCNNENTTTSNQETENTNNNQELDEKEITMPENNIEPKKEDITTKKTMKYCYTDGEEPVKYTFYITDEEIYEKSDTQGTGYSEKITTKTKSCVRAPSPITPDLEWNCIDGSVSNFQNHKETADTMTEATMASVMKIKCETVDYDESKFTIE